MRHSALSDLVGTKVLLLNRAIGETASTPHSDPRAIHSSLDIINNRSMAEEGLRYILENAPFGGLEEMIGGEDLVIQT